MCSACDGEIYPFSVLGIVSGWNWHRGQLLDVTGCCFINPDVWIPSTTVTPTYLQMACLGDSAIALDLDISPNSLDSCPSIYHFREPLFSLLPWDTPLFWFFCENQLNPSNFSPAYLRTWRRINLSPRQGDRWIVHWVAYSNNFRTQYYS